MSCSIPGSSTNSQHVRAGTPGGEAYIIAGSYADTLTRTASGWKIAAEGLGYRRLTTYDHVPGAVHDDRDPPLRRRYTQAGGC